MAKTKNKSNKYAIKTMSLITDIVCSHYKLPTSILKSKSRKRNVVVAKQFIVYFIRKLLPTATMQEIADYMQFKTHCNVLYSLKTIMGLIETNQDFKKQFEELDLILNFDNLAEDLGEDVDDICYYINLNNVVSVKTNETKGIVFSGFTDSEVEEALSLIPFLENVKTPRKHENTKMYILENKKTK